MKIPAIELANPYYMGDGLKAMATCLAVHVRPNSANISIQWRVDYYKKQMEVDANDNLQVVLDAENNPVYETEPTYTIDDDYFFTCDDTVPVNQLGQPLDSWEHPDVVHMDLDNDGIAEPIGQATYLDFLMDYGVDVRVMIKEDCIYQDTVLKRFRNKP